MDVAGLVLGAVGVVLALVSIVLVFAVERVVIEPGQKHWPSTGPFAHIAVSNRKPDGWLGRNFRGTTLTNCRVSFEFLRRDCHHGGDRQHPSR